jgi:hypothetical protein
VQPALVQPDTRRFTRSALKADGYRPKLVIEKVKPKGKPRAKLLLQLIENNEANTTAHQQKEKMKEKVTTPATPIVVMQRVGRELGISLDKLTKEKLEAAPSISEDSTQDD